MIYTWKLNFALLLRHFLANLNLSIDKVVWTLFSQHRWACVDSALNMRRLNFHFQSNFNVETTLVHRRWIDVILSTLFQRCFVNVETTSINVRRLNFHFQPNINVETTLINVIDSTLMFLLGTCKIMRNFFFSQLQKCFYVYL